MTRIGPVNSDLGLEVKKSEFQLLLNIVLYNVNVDFIVYITYELRLISRTKHQEYEYIQTPR
jgi:hypothetical protein